MFKVKTLITIFIDTITLSKVKHVGPFRLLPIISSEWLFSFHTRDSEIPKTTRAILLFEAPSIVLAQESPTESARWRHE